MNETNGHRVVVVSGGTTGIGLATAQRFLKSGHKVAVCGHSPDAVKAAQETLAAFTDADSILVARTDLRNEGEVEAFFAEVTEHLGPVSVLVCCAGISPKGSDGRPSRLGSTVKNEWDDVLSVNLTGAMLCCRAVLPQMQACHFGRIVLVGSLAGRTRPRIAGAAYAASKAALAGLSRIIVTQYGGDGITSNVIAPGRILTAMTGPADGASNREALARIPSGRLGTVDDVAAAVTFLASDEAGFINGAILDVNGGEFTPS
ncbi:SDR family NAD(P)-dependent oxidoreductase [Neorhizobium sp. P12A]|uniref:3-oxoacyl-ACP reductase FabG n=1 Tax=Neorhizobium sp. P12A TaxID=2268027 RepID=UPI0011EF64EB|nr:3-oxoacyl-ACP reductase FabG [Neorhizobium sp. P12A]KAA0693721.1 SDR family NAD(P)-dependent oxidoreductase [Neorhizobium sp. P12A]